MQQVIFAFYTRAGIFLLPAWLLAISSYLSVFECWLNDHHQSRRFTHSLCGRNRFDGWSKNLAGKYLLCASTTFGYFSTLGQNEEETLKCNGRLERPKADTWIFSFDNVGNAGENRKSQQENTVFLSCLSSGRIIFISGSAAGRSFMSTAVGNQFHPQFPRERNFTELTLACVN